MHYHKVLTSRAIYNHLQLWKQGYGLITDVSQVDRYTIVIDVERGGFAQVDRTAKLITGPDFERLIPWWIPTEPERPKNGNHIFFWLDGSYKTIEYRQTKIRRSPIIKTEIIITAYDRIRSGSIDFMQKSTYLAGTFQEVKHELDNNPVYARDEAQIRQVLGLCINKAYTKNCIGLVYFDSVGWKKRAAGMTYDNINWRNDANRDKEDANP